MLFTTTDKLKEYAELSGEANFASVKPTLRIVEQKHIVPILGRDLYDVLNAAILTATNVDPLPQEFVDLQEKCRHAIGPLFCYYYADKADVKLSDSGMKRSESNNLKTAYQEQRTKFKEANLSEGEDALEELIQFLEENFNDYTEWTDSDNFKRYRSMFIKTGGEFAQFFPSNCPHRNFWAMRAKMFEIEENMIRPILGKELFESLKEKLLDLVPDMGDEENLLLEKIRYAIANYTVAYSVPFLNVRIDGSGLSVVAAASFSTNDKENTRAGIDPKILSAYIAECKESGATWINNLTKFLTENKTVFPTWIGFKKPAKQDCGSINDELTGGVFSI